MSILIYGKEIPKINFIQSPMGGITFTIDNKDKISYEDNTSDISWRYFYAQRYNVKRPEFYTEEKFQEFINEISKHTTTNMERKFLNMYANSCGGFITTQFGRWDAPALIPQGWINWIHYDSKSKERAERVQKEPFRVDFIMKDSDISNEFIVIEIDGATHFGEFKEQPNSKPVIYTSMEAYTSHIQKDRWLRKQGWNVYRITDLELENCNHADDFVLLFEEIFGKLIDVPF